MERTYNEINDKIKSNKAKVITVGEAKILVKDKGVKYFADNVDVVVCASFEMHTNALVYLNFGQTDPLIYFSEASINNVEAYPLGPTDLALSCIAYSPENLEYGGAHVLEDLVKGKDLYLKSTGRCLEVFPNKQFDTWFNIKDLNHARLLLNQGVNQNNIVACNSGDKDINSHMGTLIGHLENSTFNSSSYLNPLINDPFCKTIGIGTKVWVSGAQGVIVGHGSNHNPLQKRNKHSIPVGSGIALSLIADIESMQSKWVRGGYLKSFGPVLYVGVGIPIPILSDEIAENVSITDDKINTTIVDFSIPRRTKPTFGQCTYRELRTSTVVINNKPTLAAPLSSMAWAIEICKEFKESILKKEFALAEPIAQVNMTGEIKKFDSRIGELV